MSFYRRKRKDETLIIVGGIKYLLGKTNCIFQLEWIPRFFEECKPIGSMTERVCFP